VISQAPSRLANQLRKKWSDNKSGKTLREWFNVGDEKFYNENLFYLNAMGKCYPGKDKSGDKLPSPICAETWLKKEMIYLKPKLIVTIGKKSFEWFFPDKNYDENLNGRLIKWNGFNVIALPHPSGANNRWKSQNKERLKKIIKSLRENINKIIS